MKKPIVLLSIISVAMVLSACSEDSSKDIPASTNFDTNESKTDSTDIQEPVEDDSIEEEGNSTQFAKEAGLYDRTFLVEKDGTYIYSLNDEQIVNNYDELYAKAFKDVIDSYSEVMSYQNQSFDFSKPVTFDNLVLTDRTDEIAINTGSYFEMDYGFDLNNVGYTYVDLDSDGTFELIFGVLSEAHDDWMPADYFERAYALDNTNVIKFVEGGSRDLFWLGSDGFIYERGSGGAAYNGISKKHFDSSKLKAEGETSWSSTGLVEDEFVGVWEVFIHLDKPYTDINEEAKIPENQITEDELTALYEEWESRQVDIDWCRLCDYIQKYSLVEL